MIRSAFLVAATLVPSVATAGELRARAIERGLEEPGRFGPAHLFDGHADTAYCAPAGSYAHVTYVTTAADAAALAPVSEIEVSADAAVQVTLRIYDSPADADGPALATATLTKGSVRVPLSHAVPHAIQIELDVTRNDPHARGPVCVGELVFRGPSGELALPDLRAAVERENERNRVLAAKRDLRSYVTAFPWVYFNPHKMTSTWESATYELHADGSFTRTVGDLLSPKPMVTTGRWSLRGDTLVLGELHARLVPCRNAPGYRCSADGAFVPIPAE